MTREEHIEWCKNRAIAEYDYYAGLKDPAALRNGMMSIMSDISKHEETQSPILQALIMQELIMKPRMTRQEFVNFINGFN